MFSAKDCESDFFVLLTISWFVNFLIVMFPFPFFLLSPSRDSVLSIKLKRFKTKPLLDSVLSINLKIFKQNLIHFKFVFLLFLLHSLLADPEGQASKPRNTGMASQLLDQIKALQTTHDGFVDAINRAKAREEDLERQIREVVRGTEASNARLARCLVDKAQAQEQHDELLALQRARDKEESASADASVSGGKAQLEEACASLAKQRATQREERAAASDKLFEIISASIASLSSDKCEQETEARKEELEAKLIQLLEEQYLAKRGNAEKRVQLDKIKQAIVREQTLQQNTSAEVVELTARLEECEKEEGRLQVLW